MYQWCPANLRTYINIWNFGIHVHVCKCRLFKYKMFCACSWLYIMPIGQSAVSLFISLVTWRTDKWEQRGRTIGSFHKMVEACSLFLDGILLPVLLHPRDSCFIMMIKKRDFYSRHMVIPSYLSVNDVTGAISQLLLKTGIMTSLMSHSRVVWCSFLLDQSWAMSLNKLSDPDRWWREHQYVIRVRLIGGMQIILILLGKWNRGVLNLFLGGGNGSD